MNYDLDAFPIDDLLADTDLVPKAPARAPTAPWPTYRVDEDPDEIRRAQLQAKALSSGRIPRWTSLTGRKLWAQWLARFEGDADLARDAALCTAERMIRDKLPATQERLFALKRVFLGIHARGRLAKVDSPFPHGCNDVPIRW